MPDTLTLPDYLMHDPNGRRLQPYRDGTVRDGYTVDDGSAILNYLTTAEVRGLAMGLIEWLAGTADRRVPTLGAPAGGEALAVFVYGCHRVGTVVDVGPGQWRHNLGRSGWTSAVYPSAAAAAEALVASL